MVRKLLAASLLIATPAVAQKGNPLAGLDAYTAKAVKEWNVPGLAIAVVKGDSTLFMKGYGLRELGKPDPVTPNTLFSIGSNTKSFTAAAIGMLVDEGKMRWDDKVTRWLPGFQLYDPYVTREITMRDVLSHRSGLGRRGDMNWLLAGYSRAETLRRIRFLPPSQAFRTESGYQNTMFLAAGEAAAAASGMSWDELVTTRILRPLGMTHTNTSTKAFANERDVATPHGMRDGVLQPIPWRNIDNVGPAGSINSSVAEMRNYLRFINNGGTFEGKQLLKPATLNVIHTIHTVSPFMPDTLFPSVHFRGYGLGWGLSDYRGRKVMQHSGGIDGNLSWMLVMPEEKLGIMILTNGDNHMVGPSLLYYVMDNLLAGSSRDWSALNLKRFQTQSAAALAREKDRDAKRNAEEGPSRPLSAYAGTFADSLWGEIKVSVDGNRLLLDGPGIAGGSMEHWQYDTFRLTWKDAQFGKEDVIFELDRDGNPTTVRIENQQQPMIFKKR
ncbi:MAG TPA: serine hydrolase [Gemmatimonadales bacterium]|nr:serine hydrolase [Gemmatimonadales bacterium]